MVQSVTNSGTLRMHRLCVHNLDFHQMVMCDQIFLTSLDFDV